MPEPDEPQNDPQDPQDDPQEGDDPKPQGEPAPVTDYSTAIPDELKGHTPEQIRSYWDTMIRTIERQGELLKEKSTAAAPTAPTPTTTSEEDLKSLVFDNPAEAIERVFREHIEPKYAPRFRQIDDIAFIQAKQAYPEFGKYEQQIKDAFEKNGTEVTTQNVVAAYLMIKGGEAVQEAQVKANKPRKSEKPTPETDPKKKKLEFADDVQRRIYENSGLSEEEWMKLSSDEPMTVDVPV